MKKPKRGQCKMATALKHRAEHRAGAGAGLGPRSSPWALALAGV